jgi:transcriptional regulator with XRE-family HTH domain
LKLNRGKLIRAREVLGYSIETVAEAAGVSKNSVLRAEHEEDIRPVTARKIAGALGVRVADLIGERENLKAQPPLPEFPEERREDIYDLVLTAARRQAEYDRKAANRALASEGVQQPAYFKDYENAAIQRLLGYPPDQVAGTLMELADQFVRLEHELQRRTEAPEEATTRSASA